MVLKGVFWSTSPLALDLSLGEFSEVGDTIEEYASEDATVVVGTVIDPDLADTLKVTVVATGLGASGEASPSSVSGRGPKAPVKTLGSHFAKLTANTYDLPPGKPRTCSAVAGGGTAGSGACRERSRGIFRYSGIFASTGGLIGDHCPPHFR